jgi:hypothetical protein
MCDYSLDFVASRPAKVGDKLVSTQFSGSITRGFAAVGEHGVAVCLLPGTELAFEKEVEYDPALGSFLPNQKVRQKVARFRKVNNEQPHLHHDAFEFPGAQIVLLTRLCKGQRATVLQLPASLRWPSLLPARRPLLAFQIAQNLVKSRLELFGLSYHFFARPNFFSKVVHLPPGLVNRARCSLYSLEFIGHLPITARFGLSREVVGTPLVAIGTPAE